MRRLGAALDELEANSAHGVYAAAAIKLLLLTGARVNEVLQARWEWVDWDRKCIILPDSKTGPKPLFLSNPALVVLRDLSARPEAATSGFIIKGRLAGKPLVNLAKPWKGLCQAAELDGVRIHDLRHTAASVGVGHGLSLPIIGRLLDTASRKQQTAMRMSMEIPLYWRSIRSAKPSGRRLASPATPTPYDRLAANNELHLISVIVPMCAELQGNHFFASRKWVQFQGRAQ